MTTLLLTAVGGTRMQPGVAFAADHLVTVVLLGQDTEGRLNDTTTQTEDKVKRGFCTRKYYKVIDQIFFTKKKVGKIFISHFVENAICFIIFLFD